jgi:hypothetical protein
VVVRASHDGMLGKTAVCKLEKTNADGLLHCLKYIYFWTPNSYTLLGILPASMAVEFIHMCLNFSAFNRSFPYILSDFQVHVVRTMVGKTIFGKGLLYIN